MPITIERIVMPSQDAKRTAARHGAAPAQPGSGMSRRSVLQGAATAGVAGLAATAIGATASPALAASSRPSASAASSRPSASAEHGQRGHPDPIVVHVRNAKSGDIEVFSGTSLTRLRDKDLAARIARVIG
jgi:nitrous oxide reductase